MKVTENHEKFGNYEATKLLLDNKASVNMKDKDGLTALHQASSWDNIEVVRLLLESGADPDIKDNYGEPPLFLAGLNKENKITYFFLYVLRF